jgi:hypothetical protein
MLNSVALFEPGVTFSLTETYQGDGYSIRYPAGWHVSPARGRMFLVSDKAILDMEIPSFPAIVIESGPLADLTSGQMAGAENAPQMIEAFALERQRDQGSEVTVGEIQAMSVGGWYGAGSIVRFSIDGVKVADLITAVHLGDRGLIVHGYGQAADLTAFTPLYTAMIKSLILAKPESSAQPAAAGKVDFTDPISAVQAVFSAAKTQGISLQARLWDSQGENDGDTAPATFTYWAGTPLVRWRTVQYPVDQISRP